MSADPIEHVIVLMMENRSFDQMLGYMNQVYPGIEGIDPKNPLCNPDLVQGSQSICQTAAPRDTTDPDPKHEVANVLQQLDVPGKCQGFVKDYAASHADKEPFDHSNVMCYFPRGSLGAVHTLAESFTVCDHWFSSLPGPTWPNRFFLTTGTSLGHADMPDGITHPALHIYNQDTIFTQLDHAGKSWAIYHGDFPQTLLLTRLWAHPLHFHGLDKFFDDAAGEETDFPEFSFLEPVYFNTSGNQNDQHPPTEVSKGEALIAQVYNAIRANQPLWEKTLFILVYDEHGGFADHVWTPPNGAIPPDDSTDTTSTFKFDRLGLRVPAILISPWVAKGFDATTYDHTSLLKYLAGKWGVEELGNRTANANSFGALLTQLKSPRTDTPETVKPVAPPKALVDAAAPPAVEQFNENQEALYLFSVYLESQMATVESAEDFRARTIRALQGPADAGAVATERATRFLAHLNEGLILPTA
jgi:phospholipase C